MSTLPHFSASKSTRWISRVALVFALTLVAAWIWCCYCRYPAQDWNSLRLAPSFMVQAGVSPYPTATEGPLATWIYGPVPIFLQYPATFFNHPVAALLAAGLINLAIALLPLGLAVRALIAHTAAQVSRTWPTLIAFAAWPAANLMFCQADNSAVAFGLIAIAFLMEAKSTDTARLWLAALAGALALWSKQTEIALILAQLVYLWLRHSPRDMVWHALRCAAASAFIGCLFIFKFGAEGLLYNMFTVPGGFPSTDLWAKAFHPIYRGYVLVFVGIPALAFLLRGRCWLKRDSTVLLPGLVFLFSLPLNLAGFATIGGNINSLHALLYLVPSVALWIAQRDLQPVRTLPYWSSTTIAVLLIIQGVSQRPLSFRPDTLALAQASSLAEQLPQQIYFPWNPLPTYFTDHKFYHAEDGILTRNVAKKVISAELISRHLPANLSVVAYHLHVTDGPIFQSIPKRAKRDQYGEWVLYSWPQGKVAADARTDPVSAAP